MKTRRFTLPSRLLVIAIAACSFLALAVPAEAASTKTELTAIWHVNRARTLNRIPKLTISPGLTNLARKHSCTMAVQQKLYHQTNLTSKVTYWRYLGENVGVSWNMDQLTVAFMKSPKHRANILNRNYREIGIGICRDKYGNYWETQIFRG